MPLRNDAQKKGMAIKAAVDRKAERGELCKVFRTFVTAEAKFVKFVAGQRRRVLEFRPKPSKVMKANHAKSSTMSNRVCNARRTRPGGPPAPPSLSDALGTSRIPDPSNIRTGKGGTFDTLGGSALAR